MIEVKGLRKEYKEIIAVDDISFTAERGSIFGLLGPNGAGKSTTIGCICGLLEPTAGQVRVMGHDILRESIQAKSQLGVVPQELAIYEDLSATENLNYWGAACGLRGKELKDRVPEVLELTGLQDRAKEPVKRFSGGMKRRLNFACGVVHHPAVLLLDEPTVGVDPQSRVRLLDLVREQAAAGTCVLYTTHYMEEAETLCDSLAIIDHGKIIAAGTLPELRALLGERDLLRMSGVFDKTTVPAALAELETLEIIQLEDDALTLALGNAPQMLSRVLQALTSSGAQVRETTMNQPNLESLFIKLTGKELRE